MPTSKLLLLRRKYLSKLYLNIGLILFTISFGIIGFMGVEGYSFIEALYMTVITLSTVGYEEIRPLSNEGRLFTIVFISLNIGIFAYAISTVIGFLANGEFRDFFKNYTTVKKISSLEQHIIVCGYGRNGKQVCTELRHAGFPLVVIETSERIIKQLQQTGELYIEGDATDEEVLAQAKISTAKALITTLPDDASNVFVVLTARQIRKDLLIISRASVEGSEMKLKRAGANNVIMPEKIGGAHMASLIVKPDVLEFIAHLSGQDSAFSLEEFDSALFQAKYHHQTIKDLDIRQKAGVSVIALRTKNGEYKINPSIEEVIEPGTKLIVLGTQKQLETITKILF